MEISETIKAIIIALVEGFTEFLPISSTGHMTLVGELIKFDGPQAKTFEIFIQLGAILAVVALYPKRFLALIPKKNGAGTAESSRESGFSGMTGLMKIGVACLPAFVIGAALHKTIKEKLLFSAPVALALIVGGLLMIFVERKNIKPTVNRIEEISIRSAFILGIFQCLALWPGFSRSGAMLIGGLFLGLTRTVAAEFSFLVAVPVMVAATGLDLLKSYKDLSPSDLPIFAIGFVLAFVTAIVAIRFMLSLLSRLTLRPFAYYRIALGVVVLILLSSNG